MRKYWAMLALLTACDSGAEAAPPVIHYTHLKDCAETVANDNAAVSILDCPKVGSYDLRTTHQSPTFFTVHLKRGEEELTTDFPALSGELPLEPGKVLEWHLVQGEPRFLIFRLGWGTEAEPAAVNQYLVLSYVAKDVVCPLATVDAKQANANQKARDLLAGRYASVAACPAAVEKL